MLLMELSCPWGEKVPLSPRHSIIQLVSLPSPGPTAHSPVGTRSGLLRALNVEPLSSKDLDLVILKMLLLSPKGLAGVL